jgi:ADP-heptose:LPS heptosyltransferase
VVADAHARLPVECRAQVSAWSDDFPLDELRALMDRAALYIGGDSGPMHIAATSQVAMVSLYGPTLPARSAPWRPASTLAIPLEVHGLACRPCDQRICQTHDFRCLAGITPGSVLDAAERLLTSERVN